MLFIKISPDVPLVHVRFDHTTFVINGLVVRATPRVPNHDGQSTLEPCTFVNAAFVQDGGAKRPGYGFSVYMVRNAVANGLEGFGARARGRAWCARGGWRRGGEAAQTTNVPRPPVKSSGL